MKLQLATNMTMNKSLTECNDAKVSSPEGVLVFRSDGWLLVASEKDPELPDAVVHRRELTNDGHAVPVGRLGGLACLAGWGSDQAPPGYDYHSLRALLGLLPSEVADIATRARQLLEWDRNHRYCGRCGTAMQEKTTQQAKLCPACGFRAFPRINPAVIVAIVRDNKLLLARNRRFKNNMHSLIAGFVEAGESLEETVHREIAEEVSIRVGRLKYVKSQAWPFPNTLMLGFTADYVCGRIQPDGNEIVEAGWFDAAKLPPIPGYGSLSRELIEMVLGSFEAGGSE